MKMDLVWASVFLTVFAASGLSIVVASQEPELIPTAVALMVGALVSLVTVPLLLCAPGFSPTLLAGGRILVCLEAACLAVACVLAASAII